MGQKLFNVRGMTWNLRLEILAGVETLGSVAQWLHTVHQVFLGAKTVFRVVPYSSQSVRSPDLSSFYSQDSRAAWKQDKAVGADFQVFSL